MAQRRPKTVTTPIHEVPSVAEPGDEPRRQSALQISAEGMALLRDRLRAANECNSAFDAQFDHLWDVIRSVLDRIASEFPDEVELVLATGEWTRQGVDLRRLPSDDVMITVVARAAKRDFGFYIELADRALAHLLKGDILLQFDILTLPEWTRGLALAQAEGREERLGIPLLVRP
jgi:hypothetical protein